MLGEKMYKTLFLSLLSTIFIACSNTSALKHFKKDSLETKSMQYTKKTDIITNGESKVILWATYLNHLKEKQFTSKEETFIVSLYFTQAQTQDLEINAYKFTLNDTEAISIEKIDKNNKKYKKLLSYNTWGSFYLIKFPRLKKVYDLNLKLSNANTYSVLKFEK